MVLKGEDGFSQTRELHVPGCTLFRRNSQDTFIIRWNPKSPHKVNTQMRFSSISHHYWAALNCFCSLMKAVCLWPHSAADSLGPVWGVHIWHDNSGPSPSWNIKHLDVSEVKNDITTHILYPRGVQSFFTEGHIQKNIRRAGPLARGEVYRLIGSVINWKNLLNVGKLFLILENAFKKETAHLLAIFLYTFFICWGPHLAHWQ